ncbi:MAG: aminoglycoside 6'-N-acetyltransferase [Chloroflexota bacterium]|nr:aminoglycoside 6'-N-acetyltransferase [Chloroflexota bacterium]
MKATGNSMIHVIEVTDPTNVDWIRLREQLWPHLSWKEHEAELIAATNDPSQFIAFMALSRAKQAVGFAEVSLRHDYVNGCTTSPVAFLEGIYVNPEVRRTGVATLLCQAVETWAIAKGCQELASDTAIDNMAAHSLHQAVGFEETERVIFFKKNVRKPQ